MKLKVIKEDLKRLIQNKFMIATIIAIMLIPLIYGGLYLAAFWEPYEHTENIKVAVVNLDKGATAEDGQVINHGGTIQENLSHNGDLGWTFEDSYKTAIKKLKANDYSAVYIIPKNFSDKLENLKKGALEKPKITFIPNEKDNYINALVNKRAFDSLQAEINSTVSRVFASSLIDKLSTIEDGLNSGSEALFILTEGTHMLEQKIHFLKDANEKISEGTETLNDKLTDATEGSIKILEASETLHHQMPDLIDGVTELKDGSNLISDNLTKAYDGSKTLKVALQSYQNKIPNLQQATDDLYTSSKKLSQNTNTLVNKTQDLDDALSKVSDGMNDLKKGINIASDSSLDILNISREVYKEAKGKANASYTQTKKDLNLTTSISATEQEVTAILMALQKKNELHLAGRLQNHFETLARISFLKADTRNLLMTANDVTIDLSNANGKKDAEEQLQKILEVQIPTNLKTLSGEVRNLFSPIDASKDFRDAADTLGDPYQEKLNAISTSLSTVKTTLPTTPSEVQLQQEQTEEILTTYAESLQYKLKRQVLYNAHKAIASGLERGSDGAKELNRAIEKVNDNIPHLTANLNLIYKNNNYLSNGLDLLNRKIPDLEQGISIIGDNAEDLSNGLRKLNAASNELTKGTDKLNRKVPDLEQGISLVTDGTRELSNGMIRLENASTTLKVAMTTLNNKMPDLENGVTSLNDTSSMLAKKLEYGASEISTVVKMNPQKMGNFMAEPIQANTEELYKVDNYGAGFTPYFVSLALWVGALALFIVIPKQKQTDASNRRFVLARYLMFCFVGLLQALLLSEVIIYLGLQPENPMLFRMFNVFLSWTFIAIVQTLIYLLDDIGKLIATVWFVLQLTSSGGTFAKELTPHFFQTISPYMPFTYSVSGIKEIVGGINQTILSKDIVILLGFQIIALLCLFIGAKFKNYVSHPKKAENQKIVQTNI